MPSKSKSQQRLMGQAYAYKTGKKKAKDLNPKYDDEIKDLAKSMTKKQLKDFAETDHKGLPHKVKESRIMKFESFKTFDLIDDSLLSYALIDFEDIGFSIKNNYMESGLIELKFNIVRDYEYNSYLYRKESSTKVKNLPRYSNIINDLYSLFSLLSDINEDTRHNILLEYYIIYNDDSIDRYKKKNTFIISPNNYKSELKEKIENKGWDLLVDRLVLNILKESPQ